VSREKVLVVGLGEVGRALFELLKESGRFEVYGFDLDANKMREIGQSAVLPEKVDVMHVCFPCAGKEEFVGSVVGYVGRFKPRLLWIALWRLGRLWRCMSVVVAVVLWRIRLFAECIRVWSI